MHEREPSRLIVPAGEASEHVFEALPTGTQIVQRMTGLGKPVAELGHQPRLRRGVDDVLVVADLAGDDPGCGGECAQIEPRVAAEPDLVVALAQLGQRPVGDQRAVDR